jgi:type II secretory pathway component PulC
VMQVDEVLEAARRWLAALAQRAEGARWTSPRAGAFVAAWTAAVALSAAGANVVLARVAAPPGPVDEPPKVAEAARPAVKGPPRALSEAEYLDGILRRNLFDVAMIDAWAARAPQVAGETGALSTLDVRLMATLVAEPAEFSSALVDEHDGGLPKTYSYGDALQGREIVAIEDRRVGLKRPDGTIEYLTFDAAGGEAPVEAAASPEVGEEEIAQLGSNKFAVSRSLFDQYLGSPELIASLGRARLHKGPDGQYDGYQLNRLADDSVVQQLGIQNKDVIRSVNGQPLNSLQSAMNAYTTMQADSNFCFEVDRNGSTMELCYDVR